MQNLLNKDKERRRTAVNTQKRQHRIIKKIDGNIRHLRKNWQTTQELHGKSTSYSLDLLKYNKDTNKWIRMQESDIKLIDKHVKQRKRSE